MSRTSDNRTAVPNEAYRDNPFWSKGKKDALDGTARSEPSAVATEKEPAERGGDGKPAPEHAELDRVGRSGGDDRNKNNGDDE